MEIIMGIKRDQIIEGDGKETIGRSKRREIYITKKALELSNIEENKKVIPTFSDMCKHPLLGVRFQSMK